MEEPVVYLGGKLVPQSQAHLNIYDLGLVLGATVTEFTRTFRQVPYRLDEHISRLYRSLKFVRIEVGMTPAEMRDRTLELVAANTGLLRPDQELGIIHFVTPGENRVYAGAAAASVTGQPTMCIHSFAMPFHLWADLLRDGAHVVTPNTRHVPPQCIDPKMKYRSRLHYYLADQEARLVDPQAFALLLDLDGNLTETGGANFLLVREGAIYSPTTRNILEGVSRDTVIGLCGKLGIPFVEKDLQPHDAINADEALLTTTPYCLAPVTRVNGLPVGNGQPGPIFRRLLAAWSEEVGLDILEQVLTYRP